MCCESRVGPWNQEADIVVELVQSMSDSHKLGRSVPHAFSTKNQRRLASTQPPRPIWKLPFDDAIRGLTYLCRDCREAAGLGDLELNIESPNDLEVRNS